MLLLSNQKVHALGQQQIVLRHYKCKKTKGNLLGAYLVKYKGLDYYHSHMHSNLCHVLFASKNENKHLSSVL